MKVASLFTGAGGLDIGLEQAGHSIIMQCEIDPGAQQVLKQRFPGKLLVPDVGSLAALPQETEILAAGFPCIDVSRAGKRKGLDGENTGLVRHVFRLLEAALKENRGVPWVLLENVEGLLDRINGQPPVIEYIVEQFERLGYASWAHRIINTASFGAPHRRKRVFVLASLHGDARDVLLSQGVVCKGACLQLFSGKPCYLCHQVHGPDGPADAPDCTYALDLANAQSGPGVDVVPTFKTGNGRICLLLKTGQLGALRTEDAERLQGFDEGYTLPCFPVRPPGVALHGNPTLKETEVERRESHRWALLGNAVSVPVAAWLGDRLANPHRHKYHLGAKDRKIMAPQTAAPLGVQRKRRAAQFEWEIDDTDIYVPAEDLYEMDAQQEDSGKEGGVGGPGSALPEAGPEKADSAPPGRMEKVAVMEVEDRAPEEEKVQKESQPRLGYFQFNIMRQTSKKAQVTAAGPSALHMDAKTAWPRAAWYIRGLGRFAAEGVGEAPILTPLTLLGDFITSVGKAPEKEALTTYFARLREQGFNMEEVVKRAQQCGAALNQEAVRITRLPGYTPDAATLGVLVWARTPAGVWWPGEALDPFHMPPTRTIPPLASAALTSAEYRASIYKPSGQPPPPPMRIGSAIVENAAVKLEPAEPGLTAVGFGSEPPRLPALRDTTLPGKRKVLVVLFGERSCMWVSPAQLLPFQRHILEKVGEGNELIAAKKMARAGLFNRAVEEAKGLAGVIAAAAKGDEAPEKGPHEAALAALAATRAAAANLRVRCGRCEACTATQGSARRCLVNRAAAAAAAGHSGAQIAIFGEAAMGARVSVWWPLDEAFYTGYITAFDPLRQRHTVSYDDGDVEIVALWAPNQLVRAETDPSSWPEQAQRIDNDCKLHKATYMKEKRASRATASPAPSLPAQPLNEFERQRADNIARNKSMLAELGLSRAKNSAAAPGSPASQGNTATAVKAAAASLGGGSKRVGTSGESGCASPKLD